MNDIEHAPKVFKRLATNDDTHDLWERVERTNATTKNVTVDKATLTRVLQDHAALIDRLV